MSQKKTEYQDGRVQDTIVLSGNVISTVASSANFLWDWSADLSLALSYSLSLVNISEYLCPTSLSQMPVPVSHISHCKRLTLDNHIDSKLHSPPASTMLLLCLSFTVVIDDFVVMMVVPSYGCLTIMTVTVDRSR